MEWPVALRQGLLPGLRDVYSLGRRRGVPPRRLIRQAAVCIDSRRWLPPLLVKRYLRRLLHRTVKLAKEAEGVPIPRTLVHYDLSPFNVIRKDQRFVLIDWGNSHINTPFADLFSMELNMRGAPIRGSRLETCSDDFWLNIDCPSIAHFDSLAAGTGLWYRKQLEEMVGSTPSPAWLACGVMLALIDRIIYSHWEEPYRNPLRARRYRNLLGLLRFS
ncbi:phosphotransferase [Halorhodospira halochloris]|uniref:phosphotransferase n=1 Tax=Halorhodospira halochloris TaxID=1052 RepID=UPI001EE82E81|nr:phosphotransferase [Halorhodospira halochloris]MCG5549494.1 phosphotransferase [Halorhodospira halochloris]